MAERYFTRQEVEALIPRLTEIMRPVMQAHEELGSLREALREDERQVSLSGGAMIDRHAWQARGTRMKELAREIEAGLGRVVELGGEPKDLSMGLVDFAHLRAGNVVNLCWKFGEDVIRYWHGLDEGFAGRKPL